MTDLAVRLNLRGRGLVKAVEKLLRTAALVADREVVRRTPVDTGRARSNWIVTKGEPANYGSLNIDTGGGSALEQGAAVLKDYHLDDGPIFNTNNVVYIMPLEQGYSRQAPAGMATQAVAAAAAAVRAAALGSLMDAAFATGSK
jgi:hypothetical protein